MSPTELISARIIGGLAITFVLTVIGIQTLKLNTPVVGIVTRHQDS